MQLERIRKREEAERVRDRELMLTGKLKPDPQLLKNDRLFQLQEQIELINKQQRTPRTRQTGKSSNRNKVRWQYMLHRLNIKSDNTSPIDDNTDTEATGEPTPFSSSTSADEAKIDTEKHDSSDESDNSTLCDSVRQEVRVTRQNPIYNAFDKATDVDDLYRIADSLLNSAFH